MEGFSFVTPVTGLNRPNTGKEYDDDSFTYLGSEVNYTNISVDIQKHNLSANRYFHGLRKRLKSHFISRKTKILVYKVLVRPAVTFASETWTLSD
jgi:hypothetical protein